MRNLTKSEYNKVKMSLTLSEIGEVMRIHHMSNRTVAWVDATENHEDYKKYYAIYTNKKEGILRRETEKAAETQYVITPSKIDEILQHARLLPEIKEMLERLELSR